MIRYPNGEIYTEENSKKKEKYRKNESKANRGMSFEKRINKSILFYQEKNIAIITKRPTPIKVIKITGKKITEGFFEKNSTTDYNGVFNGRYVDFEAKSTLKEKSFPINNIYQHQLDHLERIINNNGIAFFLIEFASLKEIYFLNALFVINFTKNNTRKSIPIEEIRKNGFLIKRTENPIEVDFLPFIKEIIRTN